MLKVAYHPIYCHPLPEGHRFPMLKYELIPEQLLYEGILTSNNFFTPAVCDKEIVLLTHTEEYYQKLIDQTLSEKEQRHIGFPQSPGLTLRELTLVQGTVDCCHNAIVHGISLNVAGGTHHAYSDRGEGFCLLNDIAVAANYLIEEGLSKKILIIDLDVHQGNGTAKIFEHKKEVFTFSMHGEHNYPFQKEKSNLDVGLPDGTNTDTYLELLDQHLSHLLETVQADFCFFQSGVDILATDKFGKLKVTMEGCKERDRMVLEKVRNKGIPLVASMGGGYSPDVKTIVEAHCNTFRLARELYG
ncbi:histone deacetylase family protein [Gynurincola endophyticus]|uniref:histone deacetylase family protein n=1 Tax=Gynurincola endophyticus TaxID=2479004 RepID=UPI000F8EA391|nr:histone deacetylase [Gynurincola endophyticus]